MDSSRICEETWIEYGDEKLKESLLKTLLKNSPFDMKVLSLKQVEETSTIDRKN